jgi:hypothetical protein
VTVERNKHMKNGIVEQVDPERARAAHAALNKAFEVETVTLPDGLYALAQIGANVLCQLPLEDRPGYLLHYVNLIAAMTLDHNREPQEQVH